ncbi:TraB/GumN family protein [Hymenobacter sp. BT186]|uniref:TraB/GumN family protein n=1 Tax=Hymenobacter telluris TaxID=2816474 RepID=A0A939EV62_9BACT|nr:TraB/GumN family protein [Hymenobacter telluris]MBO0357082.1 TraB/GumN family protein [Hymenobacter telluris]MBW3373109.1 TraB/GumN family protein [Hymenobacter norwichensis]
MFLPKKITLLAVLALTSFTTQAQKVSRKTAATATTKQTAPAANSLLWEISGKNLAQPSFLYGTIHLVCPADLQVSEPLKQAFGKTQQVVMELDMDSPTMMQEMQSDMLMKDGQNLQKLLSGPDYTAVGNYLQAKAGLPIDKVGAVKPFILSSMLYPALLDCKPASYEATFVQMAQEQKKEVLGLETVQEQLGLFDKIPYGEQSKMLADMVNKEAEAKQELQQMLALYKTQNVEQLHSLTASSMFNFQQYEDLLLDSRNQHWIAGISQYATAKPTFFAVGAAHLGGPKGVLALLRQQGYQVKAVVQ